MALHNTQIRSEAQDLVNADPLGRHNVVFSDGWVGGLLQENYSQIRFYAMDTADVTPTWELTDISTDDPQFMSCTVDADDNVHLCYRAGNDVNKIVYQLLTYTGSGTFTVGTAETVIDAGAWTVDALAIEVLGTDIPLICGHVTEGSGDGKAIYIVRRSSDDTWATLIEKTLDNTVSGTDASGSVREPMICSVARDLAGLSGANAKFALAITSKKGSKCQVLGITVDTATGAEVNSKTIYADIVPSSRGHRIGELFSTDDEQWTFGGLFYDPSGRMNKVAAVFDWDGLVFPVKTQLLTSSKYTFSSTSFSGTTYRWLMGGIQYTNGRLVYIWQQNVTSTKNYLWHHIATVSSTTVTWGNDTQASLHTVPFRGIHAGGVNRNFDLKRIMAYSVLISGTTFLKWGFWNLPPFTALELDKPVDGSTVNTDIPVFQTILDGFDFVLGGGIRFKPIYEAASSTDFVTNFRTWEPPDSAMTMSGTIEMAVPALYELNQGTWYGRQKFVDEFGQVGAVGPYSTFTVAHAPSTSGHVPTSGAAVEAGTPRLNWNFFDTSPTDSQTAYQVVVERNDTFDVILDTGKVSSDVTHVDPTIAAYTVPLRWKVRVWDTDDVVSAYSGYNIFAVYYSPTVTFFAVEADTPAPLIEWTFLSGTSPTQATYRVSIKDTATQEVVYDSGILVGANDDFQVPDAVLTKNVEYEVTIRITDAFGMAADNTYTYTPTWTGADQPTFLVDVSRFESHGFNKITWAGEPASGFVAWRVYRREAGGSWERIAHVTGGPLNIIDFLAPSATQTDYTVVQVTNLDGAEVESDYDIISTVTPTSSHYWLIDPDETAMSEEAHDSLTNPVSTMLAHVVDDPFQEEYEEEMHRIIGRGVRREVGTRWGFSGEIRAQLRGLSSLDPREERLRLEELRSTGKEMYLRNPFGDLWRVAVGTLKYKRVPGVGTSEYTEVSLPYQEVS